MWMKIGHRWKVQYVCLALIWATLSRRPQHINVTSYGTHGFWFGPLQCCSCIEFSLVGAHQFDSQKSNACTSKRLKTRIGDMYKIWRVHWAGKNSLPSFRNMLLPFKFWLVNLLFFPSASRGWWDMENYLYCRFRPSFPSTSKSMSYLMVIVLYVMYKAHWWQKHSHRSWTW